MDTMAGLFRQDLGRVPERKDGNGKHRYQDQTSEQRGDAEILGENFLYPENPEAQEPESGD